MSTVHTEYPFAREAEAMVTPLVAAVAPVTLAVPRVILKGPETATAEERQAQAKMARKVVARVRWEGADFEGKEGQVYSSAANPIKALDAGGDAAAEVALHQVAHRAGIRAVEEYWEDLQERVGTSAVPPSPTQQPQGQQAPQQLRQGQQQVRQQTAPRAPQQPQQQQQSNWAQRAAVAAALP